MPSKRLARRADARIEVASVGVARGGLEILERLCVCRRCLAVAVGRGARRNLTEAASQRVCGRRSSLGGEVRAEDDKGVVWAASAKVPRMRLQAKLVAQSTARAHQPQPMPGSRTLGGGVHWCARSPWANRMVRGICRVIAHERKATKGGTALSNRALPRKGRLG